MNFKSWNIGRVGGIDVAIHPTFWLVPAYVALTGGGAFGVAMVLAVFGCVLLHEFGHALTARRHGIATDGITLYPIGGVARLVRMPKQPGVELLVTLAGPAVNVAIAAGIAAALWVTKPEGLLLDFASTLMWLNVGLAAFNMLPAFPMDGGRVFRALLSVPMGRLRATEVAAGLGRLLAVGFGVYGLFSGAFNVVLLSIFVFLAAGAELRRVRDEEGSGPSDGGHPDVMFAPPGYRWVGRGQGAWQLVPIYVRPR